jgi:long-subunit fatty acid transport protein
MGMRSKISHFIVVLLGLVVVAQMALAGGTEFFPGFGGRTLARNGLYIAGIDGLTATVTNPAAIIYLKGRGLELSIIDRAEQQEFDSPTRGLFRSFRKNDFSLGGGAYWLLSPRFATAATYYRAADYQVEWPFAMVRTKENNVELLAFDMFNRIQSDAIVPTIAFHLYDIAFGLAVNVYHIRQHTAFPLANEEWYQDRGLSAYQFEYKQDAWAYGFSLGIMAPLSNKLRAAGMIRSGYKVTLKGDAKSRMLADLDSTATNANLSADFEMPWSFGAGLVYQLSEHVEMNVDATYSLWENVQKNFAFEFDNPHWQNRLAKVDTVTGIQASRFPLAFDNSINFGVGFEYAPAGELTYRAGYHFSQSPNSAATYSLFFPGVDQHRFSIGLGYKAESYAIDSSVSYSLGVSKKLSRADNAHSPGKYDSNNVVIGVNLQYQF